ncbi:MAG: FlgO family outer membrane protein [Desulfovibrionaceae bacterium]
MRNMIVLLTAAMRQRVAAMTCLAAVRIRLPATMVVLVVALALPGASPAAARATAPAQPQGYDLSAPAGSGASLMASSLYAADGLAANLAGRLDPGATVLVASLVEAGRVDRTSAFGRLVAHQVGSRLAAHGLAVLEPRLRAALAMRPDKGELLLSRDTAALLHDTLGAHAALLGMYQVTPDAVYVSLRLVRLSDRAGVAAYEYTVANAGAVRRLLAPEDGVAGGAQGGPDRMDGMATAASPAAPANPVPDGMSGGMAAPWAVGGGAPLPGVVGAPRAGGAALGQTPPLAGTVGTGAAVFPAADKVLVGESTGHLTDFDMQEGLAAVGDAIKLYIVFDSGSARIRDTASLEAMDRLGETLKTAALDKAVVEIGGHTDNRGTSAYNLALSLRRANAVRDRLLQKHGIAPNRLRVRGYGQTKPSASNDTEEGRAENRRVVITRLQ